MAKFIELHKLSLIDDDSLKMLLNLDDVSGFYMAGCGTVVVLRRAPSPIVDASFRVLESYDEVRRLVVSGQGAIPMGSAGNARIDGVM